MRSSQGSSPDLDFSTISSISGKPCDVYFSRNFAHSRPTGSSDEPELITEFNIIGALHRVISNGHYCVEVPVYEGSNIICRKTGYEDKTIFEYQGENAGIFIRRDLEVSKVSFVPIPFEEPFEVNIEHERDCVYLSFTPTRTNAYYFTSLTDQNTYAEIYDDKLNYLGQDFNSGEDMNFRIVHYLYAGKTYYYVVSFNSLVNYSVTGKISLWMTAHKHGFVNGYVRDKKTKEPIDDVWVTYGRIVGGTDETGFYTFDQDEGVHTIRFEKEGYETFETSVQCIDDRTVTFDVEMTRLSESQNLLITDGQYVIRVVDPEGQPLRNATVTMEEQLQTTNEAGHAYFEMPEFGTVLIDVNLAGYIGKSELKSSFTMWNERYHTIVLEPSENAAFKLIYARYSNDRNMPDNGFLVDLLYGEKQIVFKPDKTHLNLDDEMFYVSCKANLSDQVKYYQLWQGKKLIAVSTNGFFSLTSTDFEKGGGCFIRVISNNDEQRDNKIHLEFTEGFINETSSIDWKGQKISIKAGDDVPYLGGGTFNLDLPVKSNLTFIMADDKIQVGINVNLAGGKSPEEQMKKVKDLFSDMKRVKKMGPNFLPNHNKFEKQFESLIKDKNKISFFKNAEFNILGYLEAEPGSRTAKGSIMLELKVDAVDMEFDTILFYCPVTVQFKMSLEAKTTFEISCDLEENNWDGIIKIEPSAKLKAFGGIGYGKVTAVGVYGNATLDSNIDIYPDFELNKVDLTGDLGLKAYIGILSYEKAYAYQTWHLFNGIHPRGGTISEEEDPAHESFDMYRILRHGMYDASNYKKADFSYLSDEKNYIGQGERKRMTLKGTGEEPITSFDILIENTYRNAQPVMISTAGNIFAAYLQADENGRVRTVVSKYDGGEWIGTEVAIEDDLLDDAPTLLTDNDGRIWLAYMRTRNEYDGESLLSYAQNQELVVGRIDPDTLEFTESKVYRGTDYMHMQRLSLINGTPTLVWVGSEAEMDNDVLWPEKNTIYTASFIGNAWDEADTLTSVQHVIYEMEVGEENEAVAVACITDQDNESDTNKDTELILFTNDTNRTIALGVDNITYDTVPGSDMPGFLWKKDRMLCNEYGEVIGLEQATGKIFISGNSIYYSTPTDEGAELCVTRFENGEWSSPIILSKGNGYLENVSITEIDGQDYIMGLYTNVTISDNSVEDKKSLIWTAVHSVSDLGISRIDYDEQTLLTGELVPITIEIINKGDHIVREIGLSMWGNYVSTESVNIKPGESGTIQTECECPNQLTAIPIYIEEYINGEVQNDLHYEDNAMGLMIGYPDLSVQLKTLQIGNTTRIISTVRNTGVGSLGGKLFLSNLKGEIIYEKSINEIGNGDEMIIGYDFDWNTVEDNSFDLMATVKTNQEEMDDDNNFATVHLIFSGYRKIPNPGFVLPAGIRLIGDEAFMGNHFRTVKLPSGLETIGSKAFKDCFRLEQIEIPGTVTEIADDAFEGIGGFIIVCPDVSEAANFAEEHQIVHISE